MAKLIPVGYKKHKSIKPVKHYNFLFRVLGTKIKKVGTLKSLRAFKLQIWFWIIENKKIYYFMLVFLKY